MTCLSFTLLFDPIAVFFCLLFFVCNPFALILSSYYLPGVLTFCCSDCKTPAERYQNCPLFWR